MGVLFVFCGCGVLLMVRLLSVMAIICVREGVMLCAINIIGCQCLTGIKDKSALQLALRCNRIVGVKLITEIVDN